MTRWSSQAPRKTSRRSQCTRLRFEGPDELSPVLVDVLAEGGVGLADLAVDSQFEQIVELIGGKPVIDEVELHRGLLYALRKVLFVEREPELSVLEHVVRS